MQARHGVVRAMRDQRRAGRNPPGPNTGQEDGAPTSTPREEVISANVVFWLMVGAMLAGFVMATVVDLTFCHHWERSAKRWREMYEEVADMYDDREREAK